MLIYFVGFVLCVLVFLAGYKFGQYRFQAFLWREYEKDGRVDFFD